MRDNENYQKMILYIFLSVASCHLANDHSRKRDLNPGCPDLELWHECTTDCSAEMIKCIQNCDQDQNCVSNCNRQEIQCEHRKLIDALLTRRVTLCNELGV